MRFMGPAASARGLSEFHIHQASSFGDGLIVHAVSASVGCKRWRDVLGSGVQNSKVARNQRLLIQTDHTANFEF